MKKSNTIIFGILILIAAVGLLFYAFMPSLAIFTVPLWKWFLAAALLYWLIKKIFFGRLLANRISVFIPLALAFMLFEPEIGALAGKGPDFVNNWLIILAAFLLDAAVWIIFRPRNKKFFSGAHSSSGETITESGTLTIAKSSLEPQTEQVGATDFTNGWWSTFSRDWTVAPGTSQTVSMYVGSDNLGNWHSPCTILRKADLSEYCVVRMDHYGWGGSYDASTAKSSNWDWDAFMGNINGSQVSITVANSGDGFASIRYCVISADGSGHFQWYDALPVDSNDVQFALVTEESYLIFD